MENEKLLSELPFWNFLNMQEKKEIIKDSNIKKYKKDSMIFNNSNECLGMTKVISGKKSLYNV